MLNGPSGPLSTLLSLLIMKFIRTLVYIFVFTHGVVVADSIFESAVQAPDVVYWASLGRVEKVKAALESGGNSNSRDESGYSALSAASENNHLEIVKLLVASGADINYESSGFTALKLATMAGNAEVVEYLRGQGAKP